MNKNKEINPTHLRNNLISGINNSKLVPTHNNSKTNILKTNNQHKNTIIMTIFGIPTQIAIIKVKSLSHK